MQFKSKVVRGVAGAMLIPITYEALPRVIEPDDCVANGSINLCSGGDDFLAEPRNIHTLHREFETQMPGAGAWIASGQVNSTTTSATHRAFGSMTIGDTVIRLR